MQKWECNPRTVPFDDGAYPTEWSQPTSADRVAPQSERHIELKKKAIDFLRKRFITSSQDAYIETEYLWLGEEGGRYFDIALIDPYPEAILAVVEVGRCDGKNLQEIAQYGIMEIFHWPYGQKVPKRMVRPWDPNWEPDRLRFEPVE